MASKRDPRAARTKVVFCLAIAAGVGCAGGVAASVLGVSVARASDDTKPVAARTGDVAAEAHENIGATLTIPQPEAEAEETHFDEGPTTLATERGALLAYPPHGARAHAALLHRDGTRRDGTTTASVFVYLHGLRSSGEYGCSRLQEGARGASWFVCPDANVGFGDGTFAWGGTSRTKRAVVARAVRAAKGAERRANAAPDDLDGGDTVLVGFSQGAMVASELVEERQGRYRGVVLIGAKVAPSLPALTAAGVKRLVFAAGDYDAASPAMRRSAQSLARKAEGIEVRFVSLGRVAHTYAGQDPTALPDAIAWAGGRDL